MHKLLFPPATGQTLCINNEISPVYKVICPRFGRFSFDILFVWNRRFLQSSKTRLHVELEINEMK